MLKLFKQNKMFRVLLTYQFFSSIGGGMFSMFILLFVHLVYQNPVYTGIAGFLMAAPRVVSFTVGPIVDRRDKISIMRLTTFLEFLVLALLAFTPLQERFGVLFMFGAIFAYNIAALFEIPASTALLPQIVEDEEIMSANSLINITAMVGGIAIGVVLFTSLGGDINFSFLYGFSAVFVALAFLSSMFLKNVTVSKNTGTAPPTSYIRDLKEGAGFIAHNALLFIVLAIVAMDFVGEIAYVNRPMFLEYHAGAQGYVLFSLMTLIGGVIASYLMGMIGDRFPVGKIIFALFTLAGITRIIFAVLVPVNLIGALITMVIYATLFISVSIAYTSLIQKIPPKDMVGRVDTIATTLITTFVAIGAFVGGFIGNIVADVGYIFVAQGVSLVVIGVLVILIPRVRKLTKMNDIKKAES